MPLAGSFPITPEQWESVAAVYCRKRSPLHVARALSMPIAVINQLETEGIPGSYPPLKQVYLDRKAAKEAEIPAISVPTPPVQRENFHVGETSTREYISPHKTLQGEAPAFPIPAPPPEAAPNAIAAPPAPPLDTQAAISAALDGVHRDLAKALPRESALIKAYREQAIGLASGAMHLTRAFEASCKAISDALILKATRGEIKDTRGTLSQLARLAKVVREVVGAGREAVELQRLIAGLPQTISASTPGGSPTAPMADTESMLATLERLNTMRKRATAIEADAVAYQGEEGGD